MKYGLANTISIVSACVLPLRFFWQMRHIVPKYARLGCAGFLAPFYDPIRLAEEISLLDHLSNGRFNVGFAKGAFAPDSKHFNVTAEQLRPLMFESVSVIETLLHVKEPLNFDGDYFHVF